MIIAQIHNQYLNKGGEDVVLEREHDLLKSAGHTVLQYFVSNKEVTGLTGKVKTALLMPFSKEQKNKLLAFLKKEQPEVVHVHNFLPVLTPAVFYACHELQIPVVLTLHNFRLLCINGLLYRDGKICEKCISKKLPFPGIQHGCYQSSSIKSIFPAITNGIHNYKGTWNSKVDKFIFLTEFSKSVFDRSALNLPKGKTTIKPNFVEDRGYELEKDDYYLFVGRLSEEKGLPVLLETFKANGKKLIIAGEGPLEGSIRELSKTHPNISAKGFITQEELKPLFKKAKAFIFPSAWYEGFGLVLIEAFSYGTPVISSNIGNPNALVMKGHNGFTFEAENSTSLKEVIETFEKEDTLELSKNARQTFEEHYSAEKNLNMLMNIYKDVISQKKLHI
jgi:glycosyltransferase involved in cell wall biosynthesis